MSYKFIRKETAMNVTIRFMLRPVTHCKEGCRRLS
jgi:hypothetical protein